MIRCQRLKQETHNLFHIPFQNIFDWIKSSPLTYSYSFEKHQVQLGLNTQKSIGYLRLPLHVKVDDKLVVGSEKATILYVTIESGHAAVCVMEGKKMRFHTTLYAYMARKKQGLSQIKYLNKKGKSRAGSRVRLSATTDFFERINTVITELLEDDTISRIALNCNTTLIPNLFQSKVVCPFDKKDRRLYKIPVHIPKSNFSNLEKAIKKLKAPLLFMDTQYINCVKDLVLLQKDDLS